MIKLRAVVHRRWVLLALGLVLGLAAGAASAALAPPTETVSYRVSQLIIANRAAAQPASVEQDALRVTRGTVASQAARTLGVDDPKQLASRISAEADPESGSIEVSSTDPDPDRATERVGAFVSAFLDVVNADLSVDQERRFAELQQVIDAAMDELAAFDAEHPDLGMTPGDSADEQALANQRRVLDGAVRDAKEQLQTERLNARATLPYSTLGPDAPTEADGNLLPVPSGLPFRAALLGFFGVALAAGLVVVVERVTPRIDTRDELVAAAELPVLAEVGFFSRRKLPREPNGTLRLDGAWAEPYRRVRSAIQFVQASAPQGERPQVFMFTSPSPSEGKSTTTAVTALALAEAGQRTLVVGGDFRRPSVHKLLGSEIQPGIRERAQLDVHRPSIEQIVHPTSSPSLFVAPSGTARREVVGMADAARELIVEAVQQGATVLVDTSPVEVANDAIDLLPVVDEVVIVVRSGRTARKALHHTIEMLELHGAHVMGTALIGTPGVAKQQYYYEGYYSPPDVASPGTPPAGPPPFNGGAPASAEPSPAGAAQQAGPTGSIAARLRR